MAPKALQTNLDVDYVIKYNVEGNDKSTATQGFQKLIRSLADVGLDTEVRAGDESSLFVFVKAQDDQQFANVVYRSRIKDWLNGVRQIQPVKETAETLVKEPMTDAERLRMVFQMITGPRGDGGADITPKHGEWKAVEAVFPLQDHQRNKKWLTEFSKKTFLKTEDLDQVRDAVGERIAYYFAFLQCYFQFLIFPSVFGFSVWLILGDFSSAYAVVNALWTVVFVEWWSRQEHELSIRWGVRNVATIDSRRREFQPDKTFTDSITGEEVAHFSTKKRLQRQLLQIPLAIVSFLVLGAIICTCYAIEIFISEVYSGPLKSILVFTPTILLTLAVPTVSSFLTGYAESLTHFENHETQTAHEKSLVSKIFVINFITSYTAISLTSFVYVPFASIIVPYLDVFGMTVKPFAENDKQLKAPPAAQFNINPQRLPNQMFYFAVTAQIVSFAMETIVPFVTRKASGSVKKMKTSRAEKGGGATAGVDANDPPEEKDFLARVRQEASLPDYDVTTDLREMIIQFGYLALFSVVWPLTPLCYFINNWIELRGDTFKLCVESRRPTPERADGIGPWLDSLTFLAWLGSITSAALVYMFSGGDLGPDGRPQRIKLGMLMLSIFCSEHIFLIVRLLVRTAISKLDSSNMRKERSERFMVRKRFLEEAGLGDAIKPLQSPPNSPLKATFSPPETITRESLEEDARKESLHDSTPSSRFWNRQRGWAETEKVGARMIDMMDITDKGSKKKQ